MVVSMDKFNSAHSYKATPPPTLLPVLLKVVSVYKLWKDVLKIFPNTAKYSLGIKIDNFFIEVIESISTAAFLPKDRKGPYIRQAIIKLDTSKVLLLVAWETRCFDDKKYIALSEPLSEIGRRLGAWYGQVERSINEKTDK